MGTDNFTIDYCHCKKPLRNCLPRKRLRTRWHPMVGWMMVIVVDVDGTLKAWQVDETICMSLCCIYERDMARMT